jgi:hypothetical protein
MLKNLYNFNHQKHIWAIKDYAPGSRTQKQNSASLHEWGGGRTHRLLQAAYTISFLCLLRFDEVLKIQAHDIELVTKTSIKLTLPFRKTDQFGGECLFFPQRSAVAHPTIRDPTICSVYYEGLGGTSLPHSCTCSMVG